MGKGVVKLGEGKWATKDGKLLAAKETNRRFKNAEFTVARGTRATYVGRDGLIKESNLQDVNLVTNGTFDADSDWTKGTGWSINGGVASCNGTSGATIHQNISGVQNNIYAIIVTVSNYTSGTLQIGGSSNNLEVNANGTYTHYRTWTSDGNLYFKSKSGDGFTGSIDNVSVKEVKTDTPRIDFTDNTDGHLLLEPQSTNLITYSEELSAESNVTLSNTISPDGTLSGLKINETTSNSQHYSGSYHASVVDDGTIYTVSFYVKKGTYDTVKAYTGSNRISAQLNITFSTESTSLSGSSSVSGSNFMEDAGNGWYRVGFSATAHTTGAVLIYLSPKDLTTYVGDISQYTEYWGIQLEALSYPTSYIPTNGSTVTRDAETCTGSGEAIDFNSSEGVLYAEIAALADDGTFRSISLSNGTATNRVSIRYNTTSNSISAFVYQGTTTVLSYNNIVSDVKDFHKVAIKYKSGDVSFWVDGVEVATSSSSFLFLTLTDLSFIRGDNDRFFYGKCKAIRVYKEALSDSELTTLTS
tara:strand:+ start:894 stop:2477 length:1584 start_codon:yes stop_codon:yes gene_type:complete